MNCDVQTRVADDHIYHHSVDGRPLANQPNAVFGHRTDWWKNCTFCLDIISGNIHVWLHENYPLQGAA